MFWFAEIPLAVPKTEEKVSSDELDTTSITNQAAEQTADSLDVAAQRTTQLSESQVPQAPNQQVAADPTSSKFNFLQESQIDLECKYFLLTLTFHSKIQMNPILLCGRSSRYPIASYCFSLIVN